MRYAKWCASLFGIALLFVISAGSAHAQATRTWISGVGDDANPCSRTAPCKTFAGAISKTATGGEINCLDPGGFGALTITKAISIICQVGNAGVLVSGTNGFVVNAPAGSKVLIQGLDFEGLGTGLAGISIVSAARVTVQNCSIRNFTGNGIDVVGPAATRVVVVDSFIYGNGNNGINIAGSGGAVNVGIVERTVIDNHAVASINVAAGSTLFLSASKLSGSAASVANAGTFTSFGDNMFQGTATPTSTPGLK